MKLSIITVNYNNLNGLQKTFESIFAQTSQAFEYIVIDGGSTDGSKEFIEKYQTKLAYFVSEKDNGIYHAMNKGIRVAQGKYLNFMNSGDVFYDKNTLQNIFTALNDVDIYCGNTIILDKHQTRIEAPEILNFSFLATGSLNHQSCFIKKVLFDKTFYYNQNLKIVSDWEFTIYAKLIAKCSYQKLNQIICCYDFTGISSNFKNPIPYHAERDLVMKTYFNDFYNEYILIKKLRHRYYAKLLKVVNNRFWLFRKILKVLG